MSSARNLRRSARVKRPVKYTEDSDEGTSVGTPGADISKAEIEKQLEDVKEDVQKPLELFSEDDISGRKLHVFQTPTKRNSMMLKANQCRTPETPKSLKTLPVLKIVLHKITRNSEIKAENKDANAKVSRKRYLPSVNSSSDESMSEDSEYRPSDKETSSESDDTSEKSDDGENSDMDEEDNARRRTKQKIQKPLPKHEVQNTPRKIGRGHKTVAYKDYHIKTDEYFESQSEKTVTSDRTLGRLRNARLTEETSEELLINQSHISTIHKKNPFCRFLKWNSLKSQGIHAE